MGKLDPYQMPAKDKFIGRKSLLVAYTMGLGKTPIAIAAAEELRETGKISTVLIVCPASLKYQWAQKIAEFTDLPKAERKVGKETIIVPATECFIVDGDKKNREEIYGIVNTAGYYPHYVIIGYDNILVDFKFVSKIKAQAVILDEATAIKSFKATRSKRIKKTLTAEYRLALTGTPIENRPDELYSIMQWVDPEVLGRYDLFERAYINRNKYGWVTSYKNLDVLKRRVDPAMARLTDKDKSTQGFMPAVVESSWYVDMDEKTLELYKQIATDMLGELELISPYADFNVSDYYMGMDESKPSGKLMAQYTALEMLIDHPDLIIWSGIQYKRGDNKRGSKYAYTLWQSGMLDDIVDSPKMNTMLDKLKNSTSEKILIFSKFKFMLALIADHLPDSVIFSGSLSPVKKAEAVARFRNDDKCRFFLSSDAGSYGMDMNMSDLLINYDLPWSAGKQDQRNYRHIRRSSEFDTVHIRNMIVSGSFEERRLRILGRKKNVAAAILDGRGKSVVVEGDSLRDHLTSVVRPGTIVTTGRRK